MKVKPINGNKVHDPARGDYLPDEGRNVEDSQYWFRRIAKGDVVEITAASSAKEQKGETK